MEGGRKRDGGKEVRGTGVREEERERRRAREAKRRVGGMEEGREEEREDGMSYFEMWLRS